MEVFNVFATMSLADMISGPLNGINRLMAKVGGQVDGLSGKMGKFALAMASVALVAASLIMSFGVLSAKAMAFESTMADVARVIHFETEAELKAVGGAILDMSTRIPVAADALGAVMRAAAQGGIAKNDLAAFTEQAAKMSVAFGMAGTEAADMLTAWRSSMGLSLPQTYAMADAVSMLGREMGASAPALGKVIQSVGPLAMAAGLAETQVAALGAAFLSVGASPEAATTAMRNLTTTLAQGAAMSDKQAEAFRQLGFSATGMAKAMQTDAQGTIIGVLKALSETSKEKQVSLMTEIFSMRDLPAITPLLGNIGNLSQSFGLVADAAGYAGSMERQYAAASKTAQNAIQLLRNKLTATAITMGNAFLPAIKAGAEFLGDMVEGVRVFMATPFAQTLLKIIAALSGAIIGVTAFAAGIWLVSAALPLIGKALAPLKATLLAISWPVWVVIAAFAAFYLAYKNNFGGFADFVKGVWNRVSLIFNGVRAVVDSMKNGVGELRGELSQQIKAQGLLGVVTFVSKLYYRITRLFSGMGAAISPYFDAVGNVFQKTFGKIEMWFSRIGAAIAPLIAKFSGSEITSAASSWEYLGNILGNVVGWAVEFMATQIQLGVNALSIMLDFIAMTCAAFTGDFAAASALFNSIMGTIGESILAVADLFGFGDWLRESWQGAMDFLGGINLYASGAAIIDTLIDGIKAKASALVDEVKGVFRSIRDYLPFSDAKTGPLSDLTTSGGAIMTTLGAGVAAKQSSLIESVSGAFAKVGGLFDSAVDWLFGDEAIKGPDVSVNSAAIPEAAIPEAPGEFARGTGKSASQGNSAKGGISIHIGSISLPGVADVQGFVSELQNLVAEYDGVPA